MAAPLQNLGLSKYGSPEEYRKRKVALISGTSMGFNRPNVDLLTIAPSNRYHRTRRLILVRDPILVY